MARVRRIEQWMEESDELARHVLRHAPGEDFDEWVACWQCNRYLTVRMFLHSVGLGPVCLNRDCGVCWPVWEINTDEDGAPESVTAMGWNPGYL